MTAEQSSITTESLFALRPCHGFTPHDLPLTATVEGQNVTVKVADLLRALESHPGMANPGAEFHIKLGQLATTEDEMISFASGLGVYYPDHQILTIDDKEVAVTRSERRLLVLLARGLDKIISRESLDLAMGVQTAYAGTEHTSLRAMTHRLRTTFNKAHDGLGDPVEGAIQTIPRDGLRLRKRWPVA